MTKRRYLIRAENAKNLTGSEQEQFVDEVYNIVDGTGVRGTFVVSGGWDWLDWEGEASQVDAVVQQFSNLEAVSSVEVESTEESEDWTISDGWYGHGDEEAHREC